MTAMFPSKLKRRRKDSFEEDSGLILKSEAEEVRLLYSANEGFEKMF